MPGIGKIIGSIFSGSGAIKDIFNGIDQISTTKEEKIQLKNLLETKLRELELQAQAEISQRHENDMSSDSWLSKNIRPLVLIFLLAMYSVMVILDGNIGGFQINEAYIQLLGQWGMLVMSFYFGSRGAEKIAQIITKKKQD